MLTAQKIERDHKDKRADCMDRNVRVLVLMCSMNKSIITAIDEPIRSTM